MSFIGNLLWFVTAGFWTSLGWIFTGLLWSITIIGLPVGIQCFKFAKLAAFPFGKEIYYSHRSSSFLINILWIFFGGLEMAVQNIIHGIVLCLSIIGIPFGLQCFKLAALSFMPFGAEVVRI